MGIRGLYSYIQDYADVALAWHKLQKCKLVIDGNNLAHEIYSNSPDINTAFGGDYDKYATHIEKFFSKLFECEVEPIVVMDGGYPLHRNKFATVYSRSTTQLETAMSVNPDNQKVMKIFPIMGRSVFANVAQKLGVTVLQSDFEADDEIAVLAKKLNAYVLSNDSDFYLFDVPFILLHSVNMKHIQKELTEEGKCQKFIPCHRFDVNTFCRITGLRKELLPLLAPILGNDFTNGKVMEGFYGRIAELRPVAKNIPHRKKIIISVIKWLGKQNGSAEEILERIIRSKATWLSNRMKETLRNTLRMYSPRSGYLKSWVAAHKKSCPTLSDKDDMSFKTDWFSSTSMGKEFHCTCESRTNNSIVSIGKMPDWFIRAYRLHLIPNTIADILTKDYLFTVPMIEVLEYKSLYLRLEVLIKKIRGFLWSTCAHGLSMQITGMEMQAEVNKVESGFFMNNLKGKKRLGFNETNGTRNSKDDESKSIFSYRSFLNQNNTLAGADVEVDRNECISNDIDVSVVKDRNCISISKNTKISRKGTKTSIRKDTEIDINKDIKIIINKDKEIGISKDSEIGINKDTEISISKDTEIDINKDTKIIINKDEEISISKDSEIDINKDTEISINKDTVITISKDTEISIKDSKISIGKDAEILISKDTEMNISKDTEISINKDTEISFSEDTEISISKDTKIDINKDTKIIINKDEEISISKDSEIDINKDTEISINKDTEISISKDTEININKDIEISIKDTEISISKDAEIPISKDTEMNIGKDTEISINKDTEISFSKDTEIGIRKDTEISINKDTEISIGKETKNINKDIEICISKDTEISISKDTEINICKDTEICISKDTEISISKDKEISINKDTEISVSKDTGISITTDAEINICINKLTEISISKDTENNDEVIDNAVETETKHRPENIDAKCLEKKLIHANNRLDNDNCNTNIESTYDVDNTNSDDLYDEDVIGTLEMHYLETPYSNKNLNEKLDNKNCSKNNYDKVDDDKDVDDDDISSDICDDESNEISEDSDDNFVYNKVEIKNVNNITKIHYIPPLRVYVRERDRLEPKTLQQENVHTYKKFPSLFKIDKWTQLEKKTLFYNTVGIEMDLKDEVVSSTIEFILLSICFWKKNFDKHVEIDVILSVLMCVVMYTIIDSKIGRVRSKGSPEEVIRFLDRIKTKKESGGLPEASSLSLDQLIQNLCVEECRLASISLNQFHKLDPKTNGRNYDRVVIHSFSEFQAGVYFLQYLNSLLYFPFPIISMDCIWSGTFCYNVYNCFSPCKDPNTVLPTIFCGNDRISYLYFKLYSVIQLSLNLPQFEINFSSLSVDSSKILVKKKKLGVKKNRTKARKGKTIELQTDKLEDPTEEDLEALAENKFAALLII